MYCSNVSCIALWASHRYCGGIQNITNAVISNALVCTALHSWQTGMRKVKWYPPWRFGWFSCLGHLIHRFGITENDWHRIKQNIDSKCRTAWRRRQRGMPLTVKAFRGKSPATYVNINNHMGDLSGSEEDSMGQDGELHIHQVGCNENLTVWFGPHKVCWSIQRPQQTADFCYWYVYYRIPPLRSRLLVLSPLQINVKFFSWSNPWCRVCFDKCKEGSFE